MTDYADLREALDQICHALLIEDPETIRALLAERDALRDALKQYASPENWENDEHGWARLWLEPDSTSRRSYDGSELAFAALAQNQGD